MSRSVALRCSLSVLSGRTAAASVSWFVYCKCYIRIIRVIARQFPVWFAPYGFRGSNVPWFMCWYRRYINCLSVYLLNFLPCLLSSFLLSLCFFSYLFTSLFVYFLTYLSAPSRIDPFRFQARVGYDDALYKSPFTLLYLLLVSDIAMFVLKRDVNLKLTN